VRATQTPVTGLAPDRNPREARGHALATTAGVTLVAMAVLAVSNGELGVYKDPVRVVVAVGSLAALILGVSLCILSRFARRRLPGASLGTWAICALCLPYLLLGLLAKVPGFAVQVTFPGGSVVSTANLEATLDDLRPAWYQPLDTTLSVACVVMLVLAAWALTAAARNAVAAQTAPAPRTGPAATPTAVVTDAGAAPEASTAHDPWIPTRVDEVAPGEPSSV